jgi:hypothetical protein
MVHYDMRSSVLLRKPYGSIPKYNLLNNLFEYSYAFWLRVVCENPFLQHSNSSNLVPC